MSGANACCSVILKIHSHLQGFSCALNIEREFCWRKLRAYFSLLIVFLWMKFPPSRTMKQKLILIVAVITLAQCGVPGASGQWVQVGLANHRIFSFTVSNTN